MRIAICDDEKKICLFMKEIINRFYFDRDEETYISCFEGGEQLLQANLSDIDLLFLDIEMPGYNGLDVAKIIRKENQSVIIVFVTAYDEFVFESFKVKAYRYLLKPLKEEELIETLQSVQQELYSSENELSISFQNNNYRIRIPDITYVEGMKGKIWIYCKSDTYRYRGALKDIDEMLKGKGFFQIHQSYIINMNKIVRYDKTEIVLEGGYKVPVSRYKWKGFQEEYARYWSKVL